MMTMMMIIIIIIIIMYFQLQIRFAALLVHNAIKYTSTYHSALGRIKGPKQPSVAVIF